MTYIKRDFIGHGFCPGIEVAILQCFPPNCLRAARTVVVDAPNDETISNFMLKIGSLAMSRATLCAPSAGRGRKRSGEDQLAVVKV